MIAPFPHAEASRAHARSYGRGEIGPQYPKLNEQQAGPNAGPPIVFANRPIRGPHPSWARTSSLPRSERARPARQRSRFAGSRRVMVFSGKRENEIPRLRPSRSNPRPTRARFFPRSRPPRAANPRASLALVLPPRCGRCRPPDPARGPCVPPGVSKSPQPDAGSIDPSGPIGRISEGEFVIPATVSCPPSGGEESSAPGGISSGTRLRRPR